MDIKDSLNFENLKKVMLSMKDGERVPALWGVRELWSDATRKDRMVDYAFSIDKEKNKYTICGVFDFPSYELFWDALEFAGVRKWYHFKGWAVKLKYEDMIKVLSAMPKFFDKYSVNRKNIWHYLSFDREECKKKCEEMRIPYIILELEKEIRIIEKYGETLEEKKAKLKELKEIVEKNNK